MRRVTPTAFREAFASVIRNKSAALRDQWLRHDNRAYTAFIRAEILPPIAERLGLKHWCQGDYNQMDAVFFEDTDTEHFASGTYAKALSVVIEHENVQGRTTFVEMNKLQHYNTPLKVFIGYAFDDRDAATCLKGYAEIIRDSDIFGDIATHRRQLVIFGEVPSEGYRWSFYSYEPAGFAALPELRI